MQIPYRFQPRNYQLNILKAVDSGIKRAVWVAHRRSGKDKTVLNLMIKRALLRVGTYFYIAPTYSQIKKIVWDGMDKDGFRFLDHIPKELIDNKNDTEMKIKLKNGSIIQFIGSDNVDSLVGTNPIGCVFTEYSLQSPRAWDLLRPILAENGGWAVFMFTPRGMNHGWKILQQAKESKDWFWEILTVDDTKAISEEVLDQEWREMPEALYEQEYLCKFIEGATSVFKRVDENTYDANTFVVSDKRRYRLGIDWAKVNDYTVIAPFDLTSFRVGPLDRFNQIDYNLQKAKVEAAYYKHFKPGGRMDSTGVGEPLFDDLQRRGLSHLEPFHFTEQSRKDLLMNLVIKLEQGIIKIPNDPILLAELKSFQYEVTSTGKVRMAVPENMHDDCVMAVALAVWDIPENPLKPIDEVKEEKELLRMFDANQRNKDAYFSGSRYLRR